MTSGFREASGEAPPAPRDVTRDVDRDSAIHGRMLRLFGAVWGCIGWGAAIVASVIAASVGGGAWIGAAVGAFVGIAGTVLWLAGWAMRKAALATFRDGVEVSGEVVEVFQDLHVKMNNRHPWRVAYQYVAQDGTLARGSATFWTVDRPEAVAGQRVVALHDPKRPSRSVLWTRLDRVESSSRVRVAAEELRVRIGADSPPEEEEMEAEAHSNSSTTNN